MRALVGLAAFAAGVSISPTMAAVAKIVEAALARLLYRKPMLALVGGPAGALRDIYLEALLLTLLAVLPATLLMTWTASSPPPPCHI